MIREFALTGVFPNLQFFNSMGRKLERFESHLPGKVTLYTCGPTIYHYAHIGNLRTFLFEDLLHRTLKLFGYEVKHVMNLTDVDDKTIRESIAAGMTLREYTDQYAKAFFEDLETLNVLPATFYPRATDFIPEMIEMIEKLIQEGYAYQGSDGSVYFSLASYKEYGKLAQLPPQEATQMSHSRIQNDEYDKEIVGDFVLWKAYDASRDGGVFWPSPFGKGRPGWHIECSAMAKALLGEEIDIHTGGIDNLFPHHENEIAQSQCCNHRPLARFWLHADHLLVDGRKMSKSLGNFFTLRELLEKGCEPMAIRYLLLQTHYRHSLNFTMEGVKAAMRSLERLRDFHYRLQHEKVVSGAYTTVSEETKVAFQRFCIALADDLNASSALSALFDWVGLFHKALDEKMASSADVVFALDLIKKVDSVFGVIEEPKKESEIDPQIQALFESRQEARRNKQWQLSDELRLKIDQAGYLIEDSPQGSRLKKKTS